ncbi:hypothetical protein Droror1_Dr00025052, partial [Drosera rotundifolia]
LILILLLQGCWLSTNVICRTSGAVIVERKNLVEEQGPSYRGKQWRQTEGVTEVHILVVLAHVCLNKLASNCIQGIPRFELHLSQ